MPEIVPLTYTGNTTAHTHLYELIVVHFIHLYLRTTTMYSYDKYIIQSPDRVFKSHCFLFVEVFYDLNNYVILKSFFFFIYVFFLFTKSFCIDSIFVLCSHRERLYFVHVMQMHPIGINLFYLHKYNKGINISDFFV